ncbi:MAG: metallophosphoesterase [Candidatus Pacearchaeota archaeon]
MREDVTLLLSQGYLVEQEVAQLLRDIFSEIPMTNLLLKFNPPKLITKNLIYKNIFEIVGNLESGNFGKVDKNQMERIKAYFSIEVKKEIEEKPARTIQFDRRRNAIVIDSHEFPAKKITVEDFVQYFRDRYFVLKNCLQERDLVGLSSIGKISNQRRILSVIGLVYDIRYTKNKNMLIELEDMTSRIPIIIHKDKTELFEKAQNIVLDEVIAVTGAGSREIMFANDVIFPNLAKEKKFSPKEELVAFTADIHIGSAKFLEQNFLKFIDWLNGNVGSEHQREIAKKIKYLFIVGDTVDGVGVYPKQEKELLIKDVREQYKLLAEYLGRIRKDVTIIMCAGGKHDAVRQIEPQPKISKEFAPELHQMDNVLLTVNPSVIRIGQTKDFQGFDVLMYHGDSFDYYGDAVDSLRLNNAKFKPDMISHFLLNKRHLAPSHTSTTYYPSEKDYLVLRIIPDIFVTGHIHKSAVSHYNNILTISCSCWQSKTAYQEKFGHEPDPCKVPILNLKTGKVNIMDFS